ncbi:MAG: tRNA preQ1(34) S-adenosylmethionine ribosyltransferase-isomerase QueA [Thermoleophilia bacterium]|nr:tRNA preQ1(34) S-adenosylmethionine ribosyltransferase-isomerase QueA [Thermoleophilia bacterium]
MSASRAPYDASTRGYSSTGATMRLADLDYELPRELIAQQPAEPRDAARLLVVERSSGCLRDRTVRDLPGLLRRGDLLVRNDTRVFPARAFFRRASGGRIEVLFLRPLETAPAAAPAAAGERWEALLRGRPRTGEELAGDGPAAAWRLVCERPLGDGRWVVASLGEEAVLSRLEAFGQTPTPPYIRTPVADPGRYQTTYARRTGSAAAPTAGLHFTAELDARLAAAGVDVVALTLHVGLGTFKPLQEERLADNRLHGEAYEVDEAVWRRVEDARATGRRVIAVGTTTVRVLEHVARGGALRGETDLFIMPGFTPRVVGGLLTNFHLPRTSLLALVMTFAGVEPTRAAYEHAVRERYRFFSFGDAMLVV